MAGLHSMQPHERVNTMNGDPVQAGSLKNALNKFIGADGVNTYSTDEALNLMMGNDNFSIRDTRILLNQFLGVDYQTYTIQEALNVIEAFYPKTKADQELKAQNITGNEVEDIINGLDAELVEQPCGVFDGTTSVLNCGSGATIDNIFDNGGTIEAYINAISRGEGNAGRIFDKRSAGHGWRIYLINESGTSTQLYFTHEFSTTDGAWITDAFVIPYGEDTHVKVSYDNSAVANNPTITINGIAYTVGDGLTESITPVGTRGEDASLDLTVGNTIATGNTFDGSIWDVKCYKGFTLTLLIPDPSTGYDISGNGNHGVVTDVAVGTQDESAVIQSIGFNKYLKCTSDGVIAIASDWAYGEIEFDFYNTNILQLGIMSDDLDVTTVGTYRFDFYNTEQIRFIESVIATQYRSATSYYSLSTMYRIKVIRTALGVFNLYIKGGAFGWSAWTHMVASEGTNPFTDTTITSSINLVIVADNGSLVGNIKQTDLSGNVCWLSDDINDWHVVSGTFENHLVPADMSTPTKDVLGNSLHYLPKGILPLGAIEFNPDNTNPTPAKLRVYDRNNIIGQTYEYWKPEIKDIASYDVTHPERHQLTEFSGDYIRVFGTQLLINRLFMKEYKNDSDWIAIQNILNFNELLSDADKVKTFRYLQDPSKSNQEAWELYQDSDVVASYRFDQPLSLFNEDGGLCKLGWEGEELFTNGDFSVWNGAGQPNDYPTGWSLLGNNATNYVEDSNGCHFVADGGGLMIYQSVIKELTNYVFRYEITQYGSGALRLRVHDTSHTLETSLGVHELKIKSDPSGTIAYIRTTTASNISIDNVSIVEVGDTCAKVLDVGSGGVDGLTYYNLTQSDLSLQPKHVAGGLEFDGIGDYLQTASEFPAMDDMEIEAEFYFDSSNITTRQIFRGDTTNVTKAFVVAELSGIVYCGHATSAGVFIIYRTDNSFTQDEFHIVKMTSISGAILIYVDGVLQDISVTSSSNSSDKKLTLGARGDASQFSKTNIKSLKIKNL